MNTVMGSYVGTCSTSIAMIRHRRLITANVLHALLKLSVKIPQLRVPFHWLLRIFHDSQMTTELPMIESGSSRSRSSRAPPCGKSADKKLGSAASLFVLQI